MLLYNRNLYGSVTLNHSATLRKKCEEIKLVLERIFYKWVTCVDLKMVNFFLEQQSGYTKWPCFLCMWGSRDRVNPYVKKDWLPQTKVALCRASNILVEPLIEADNSFSVPLLGHLTPYANWWWHVPPPTYSFMHTSLEKKNMTMVYFQCNINKHVQSPSQFSV